MPKCKKRHVPRAPGSQHGGTYSADIGALRNTIRANGAVAHIQAIPVSHPLQPAANLTVFVNLAYQSNGALALGYAHPPLPNITDATLSNAVAALSGYNGGELNAALLDSLARVNVAVSEAARFSDVSGGVAGVLGSAAPRCRIWANCTPGAVIRWAAERHGRRKPSARQLKRKKPNR
ncbi:ribosome-inactivating family protein [Duganella sacchari]|uniref:ribosome-inactivating family protein n=1 Tax=Duganella sacchari TaxID=551987 RepID=UPI00142F2A1F|nr:ribosome-inactivating family protein [Duganella sacchari]